MGKRLIVFVLVSLFLSGCIGGSSSIRKGMGTVGVFISADALPETSEVGVLSLAQASGGSGDEVKEVWVSIKSVTIRGDQGDITLVEFDEPQSFDLLSLGFQREMIGKEVKIPSGRYKEIRFQIASEKDFAEKNLNRIVYSNGTVSELKVPSSELKPKFTSDILVTADAVTQIVFDINTKYLVEKGNGGSNVNPRKFLRVLEVNELGEVHGRVSNPEIVLAEDETLVVKLTRQGDDTSALTPAILDEQGFGYKFTAVSGGDYALQAIIMNQDGAVLMESQTYAISLLAGEVLEAPLIEWTSVVQ